jgi:hypothetical protein
MLKVGGATNGDIPAPVADNNLGQDAPADDNNPGPDAAEGPNRLKKLGEDAKNTVAGVAGAGLGMLGAAATGAKGVVDLAAGFAGWSGQKALTSAQNQETKLKTAAGISDSKVAAAVSESEAQAYMAAIDAEKKAQEHHKQKLKNEISKFKDTRKQREQQQTIKENQNRIALNVVNANKVDFVGKNGQKYTTSFKVLEEKEVDGINMVFAVPKTMGALNEELLKTFGRNFENGDFDLDRGDKAALFRSLGHNFAVPPVEYLKGWIKWLRGQNPVLKEKKNESDDVVSGQPAATGGGKTKRKKRTYKRKKKTSKRKKKTYKKRTYKRKKKTYKRKKRTLKKRY